jgi:hypothetical protein
MALMKTLTILSVTFVTVVSDLVSTVPIITIGYLDWATFASKFFRNHQSSYHPTLYSLGTERASLNNHKKK